MKPDLINYLMTKGKEAFDIEANNCYQFTNNCWLQYYGHRWCETDYSNLQETGYDVASDFIDTVLERSEKPQEGHLVALDVKTDTYLNGVILGFCVGDLSVFLNSKGLKYLPTKLIQYSWKNRYD